MIICNVTTKIDMTVADEWLYWMEYEHLPALMNTGLFTGYRLCRLLEQDDAEGPTYTAQYYCASREDYDIYIAVHAPVLREQAFKRFGNKVVSFRTLMDVILKN